MFQTVRPLCAMLALVLCGPGNAWAIPAPSTSWPKNYMVLTFESGHTYKLLNSGPIMGKDGKPLGFGVAYVGMARSFEELKAAAEELFEYARPMAERLHEQAVIVIAKLGFDPGAIFTTSTDIGVVYQRDASGVWRGSTNESKPFPQVSEVGAEPVQRDPNAEGVAKANAESWLALLDARKVQETWDAGSPHLKKSVAKNSWVKDVGALRASAGTLVSRTRRSVMATPMIPRMPTGRYVVIDYRSKYANRPDGSESVVEMLCDDGQWRIAGYALTWP